MASCPIYPGSFSQASISHGCVLFLFFFGNIVAIARELMSRARTTEYYFLRPNQRGSNILCIDRLSFKLSVESRGHVCDANRQTTAVKWMRFRWSRFVVWLGSLICLLVRPWRAVKSLTISPKGPHLIVITRRREMGQLAGHRIWRMEDVEILPFSRKTSLNDNQVRRYSLETHIIKTHAGGSIIYSFQHLDLNIRWPMKRSSCRSCAPAC